MPGLMLFLIFLFVLAALLRVDFFFTILYLLLGVYVLSQLWIRRSMSGLHAERRFVDHAFSGEQVEVEVVLRNGGWLPVPWVELNEGLPIELISPPFHHEVVSLGSHGEHRFHYTLDCRRRGYYSVGPLRLQAGDLLGMLEGHKAEVASQHVIVYPRIVPLQKLGLPTRSPLVALPARSPLFEDPARIMGVREYQRGDSPRRIHWTASAATGQLVVKQYQASVARETMICLDLAEGGYEQRQRFDATELAIVAAASIATHISVHERLPVGLALEALDPLLSKTVRFSLPPRCERGYLMNLLEVLARVHVAPATPLVTVLREESTKLPWGATILVVAGRQDMALTDTLAYLRRSGFAVALILVQSAQLPTQLQQRVGLLGVPVYKIWTGRDLEAWR